MEESWLLRCQIDQCEVGEREEIPEKTEETTTEGDVPAEGVDGSATTEETKPQDEKTKAASGEKEKTSKSSEDKTKPTTGEKSKSSNKENKKK